MTVDSPANLLTSPFGLRDEDGYVWLKGNLHSHTTNSDGKPSPQERLDGYVDQGYDYLCLSDHYDITRVDSVRCPADFTLVQEWNCIPTTPSAASAITSSASTWRTIWIRPGCLPST